MCGYNYVSGIRDGCPIYYIIELLLILPSFTSSRSYQGGQRTPIFTCVNTRL